MKKNWTMRVALLVVALTLITSCFVGGTFAKYVTGATAEDTARVAKFGVTIEADGALFDYQYETDDDTLTDEEAAIVGEYSVKAAGGEGDNVVAPGTTFEGGTFKLSGTPEVAVRIGYTVTIDAEGWEVPVAEEPAEESEEITEDASAIEVSNTRAITEEDESEEEPTEESEEISEVEEVETVEYFPIIFTINGVQYKVGEKEVEIGDDAAQVVRAEGDEDESEEESSEAPAEEPAEVEVKVFDSIKALIEGIEEDLAAYSAVYAAGTDLSAEDVAGLTISWEWPFEGDDVSDTALGDAAAAGNAATLTVTIGVTVTQID